MPSKQRRTTRQQQRPATPTPRTPAPAASPAPAGDPAAPSPAAESPAGPVHLNLDTLDRESGDGRPIEPFTFVAGGHRFQLPDAREVPWQDLAEALVSPLAFFTKTIAGDQGADFLTVPLPPWKMNRLIKEYMAHYGMGQSPGESNASSTS
jgi:hypothetical protein